MSKAPSPPQPVNPFLVGGAQQQSNINSAIAGSALNDINQITPYGTVTYTFGTPSGGDVNPSPKAKSGGGFSGGSQPMVTLSPGPIQGGGGNPPPSQLARFAPVATTIQGMRQPTAGTGLASLMAQGGGY